MGVLMDGEPRTLEEALSRPDQVEWRKAAEKEYKSLLDNETWTLVPRNEVPSDRKVIEGKWVLTTKRNVDGSILRHKGRWVAKGYFQREGVDYTETFAPVAKMTSLRLLLSHVAVQDWELEQLDVETAFLNGYLEEEVYMEQPHGFVEPGKEEYVCKLQRSLYGLKQSPRAWYERLHEYMMEMGFERNVADHSEYSQRNGEECLVVLVYVDDLVLASKRPSRINDFKARMAQEFKMRDLGAAHVFLGLEIVRDRNARTINLTQRHYAEQVLERFGMKDSKPIGTPTVANAPLAKEDVEVTLAEHTWYRSAVGSLMYLMVATRPDIAYAVGAVSKYVRLISSQ